MTVSCSDPARNGLMVSDRSRIVIDVSPKTPIVLN